MAPPAEFPDAETGSAPGSPTSKACAAATGLLAGTPWRWLGRVELADAVAVNAAACARLRADPTAVRGEIACFEPAAAVFTMGRRAQTPAGRAGLAASLAACAAKGIEVVAVERGGLGTLHLPGQLIVFVAVPCQRTRLRLLVCELLGAARALATAAGLATTLDAEGDVGLWAAGHGPGRSAGKLASIGLYESRGIVSHGLSLNVAVDGGLGSGLALCGSSATRFNSLHAPGSLGDSVADAVAQAAVAYAAALGLGPRTADRVARNNTFWRPAAANPAPGDLAAQLETSPIAIIGDPVKLVFTAPDGDPDAAPGIPHSHT